MNASKKDISDFFTSNGFNLIETEDLSLYEKQSLINLWNREYPQGLSHSSLNSFNHYLDGLSNAKHFLLKELSKCGFEVLLNQRIKSDVLSAVRIKWIAKHSASSNVFS